ncbi:threonine aldolase family protein [Paenibacillus periandrae]|uniref:threonine aldolase family protein n=1 Tax=Paenibacillus periandrae TaxID=1761741 RepID=UPI001F090311|nr:GntG family PLP-dependent aldolase [Paenibacillus periandrae]
MIDLRSDTAARIPSAMLANIITERLGDDGQTQEDMDDDEKVKELQQLACDITGKQDAALFPTVTMANLAAVYACAAPGEQVLVERDMHLYRFGQYFAFHPDFGRRVPIFYGLTQQGAPDVEDIGQLVERNNPSLICLENTLNFTGGVCIPPEALKEISLYAHKRSVHIHVDGARLFNASCALSIPARELCQHVNSVAICLSKGLGAPIGGVLCGEKTWIERTRKIRKLLGGTIHKAGIIAAPGIYVLQNNIERLKEDHANAQLFVKVLKAKAPSAKLVREVQTNLVLLDISQSGQTSEKFLDELALHGVLGKVRPNNSVRLAFHQCVSSSDAERAALAVADQINCW